MIRPLKIAIAIPTFNRLSHLQAAIGSIERQEIDPSQIELYCVLANSASYDGTTEYLDSLTDGKLRFVVHNEISFSREEANTHSGPTNWSRVAAAVPQDIDWVWFMGDDDHLTNSGALQGLAHTIQRNSSSSLAVIHASQARRSRRTGMAIQGRLLDLCNSLGFHEMLGWMSSLIIRGDIFRQFMEVGRQYYPESAYGHSAAILELACDQDALFLDVDWVDTQDEQQTPESIQRWTEVSMGERYFYVVDGVISQFERGILKQKLKPVFYRYHSYSLWDRYCCYLISRLASAGQLTERESEHWNRVRRIADTIDDPTFVKMYLAWHSAVTRQFNSVIHAHRHLNEQINGLVDYHNQMASGCYSGAELLDQFAMKRL